MASESSRNTLSDSEDKITCMTLTGASNYEMRKGMREFPQLASASFQAIILFLAASASDQMLSIRLDFLDPVSLIRWGGVVGIAVIIFVETGLLFGFVFPGDSLLIAAGMLAEEGYLDLRWLLVLATVAAITGGQVNYAIGLRLGNTLSKRYAQFSRYLTRAEVFYEKHGGKTIALARFVPVVRTFAPAVAGTVKMNYRSFTGYNIVGGILWVFSMTLAGYSLGKIPDVEKYLLVIIVIVVIASLVPQIFEWRKMRNKGLEHDPKQ